LECLEFGVPKVKRKKLCRSEGLKSYLLLNIYSMDVFKGVDQEQNAALMK
jgi:hypothetical protein